MSSQWSWSNEHRQTRTRTENLSELLHPSSSRVRMIAVLDLRAYFDESGTDAASDIVVVGGYLAPADEWNVLESKWLQALKERNAPYYHSTDAEAVVPGRPYKGWTVEQARELTDCMVSILQPLTELKGIAVHVAMDDWMAVANQLIKPHLSPKELDQFPKDQFNFLFQMLAKHCIDVMLDNVHVNLPEQETIAIVFEDNDYKQATLAGRDRVKAVHPLGARIGSIAFETKTAFAGLQAADLFAWSYRRFTTLRRGYKTGEIHRSLPSLVKRDFQWREVTQDHLTDFVKRIGLLIGRPL